MLETRRQRKVKPHWNWRVDVSQSLLPWRDAPRRVFAAIGKGRERHEEGIYRSRDRWHSRFHRPIFPTGVEKWTEGQEGRASRRPVDVASKLLAAMYCHLRSFPACYLGDYELQRGINLHGEKRRARVS